MSGHLPVLGLMLGDYTGIGPEQCARVLADKRLSDAARLVVVGDARVLAQGQRDAGVRFDWRTYKTPGEIDWASDDVPLIDLGNLDPAQGFARGVVSAASGRIAGETLAVMVEMALARLSANKVVELDPDRRAAMVSNLLVVLCGDRAPHPVVNTGTIY